MTVIRLTGLAIAVFVLVAASAQSSTADAATRNCGSVLNYPSRPDIVSIKADGVSCGAAKRLIDAAFLKGNWPYGATRWSYRGWTWTQKPNGADVMSTRVNGTRGNATISGIRVAS